MVFADDVDAVLAKLGAMLKEKNAGYGNSALSPVRIFSKADNLEQIRVRIDDKLSRIMRGNGAIKEDTIFDLMGYLVLLRIAEKRETAGENRGIDDAPAERSGRDDSAGTLATGDDHSYGLPSRQYAVTPLVSNPGDDDERRKDRTKPRVEINPVPQSSDSSAPCQHVRLTDLRIEPFPFDGSWMISYQKIFFLELDDGRVVIQYGEANYYSEKAKVMTLPYPPPPKYYDGNGWNSSAEQAFKQYRKYLAGVEPESDYVKRSSREVIAEKGRRKRMEEEKQKKRKPEITIYENPEDPEDWKYKPILKQNTRPNREEEKIEGEI